MPGIRLHPAYHGYRIDGQEFSALLTEAARRNLVVQLVVAMEDERTQNPIFRVPHVDLAPLGKVVRAEPESRLVLLNAFRSLRLDDAHHLASSGHVWFDIAMLEGVDRVAALVEQVGPERLLFGSHWPLFLQQAAILKLHESSLPELILQRVRRQNAQDVLGTRAH